MASFNVRAYFSRVSCLARLYSVGYILFLKSMVIRLDRIVKRFGTHTVVDDVSFAVSSGEMFFVLGPSGCGKTTLLRLLAGFLKPDKGHIYFGSKEVDKVPPYDRNTALVFQNYALWPHLTVFENVAYGLRIRKAPRSEIQKRVTRALEEVQMKSLADRKPAALSGGQQQRVALARAIVVNPGVLLFDEPLSNLDAKLRIEVREVIRKLQSDLGITAVYVTHDQEEALSLADRIAILNAGKIEQIGAPQEVYNLPINPFVAQFIGEMNLCEKGSFLATRLSPRANSKIGFRPERVRVTGNHGIPVTVKNSSYLGSKNEAVLVTQRNESFKAWLPDYYPEGKTLHIEIPSEHILLFSK